MKFISKSFPGVNALNNIEFHLYKGEVHALAGENGAGKSVLLKILSGFYQPDTGQILLNGEPIKIDSEESALKLGIAMIHQELNPLLDMSVADNIFLNHYPTKGFMINRRQLYLQTQELFEMLGMHGILPSAIMGSLTMAQRQMVEIAKALAADAQIIIMDEPTSSLSDNEVEIILQVMQRLRKKGIGIIFTSHKLDEILRIADRITVLRDGQIVDCRPASYVSYEDLIIMMAGHKINELSRETLIKQGPIRLEVKELCSEDCFKNISFQLHGGEVLCLAGLVGAKKTEVAQALFGLRKVSRGTIFVDGKAANIKKPCDAIKYKIAYVPEDRKTQGLFLEKPLTFNISVTNFDKIRHIFWLDKQAERNITKDNMQKFSIKAKSADTLVRDLSGGGQQKIVLAKWLERSPNILILDDPTRGIDVGARQEIYHIINDLAKQGKAVLLVSSNIPEIIALSDRVIVMNEGKIKASLIKNEINQENIMRYAVEFS